MRLKRFSSFTILLAIAILIGPVSAKPPPPHIDIFDEKFEQWHVVAYKYLDNGQTIRFVEYVLGEYRVSVRFSCWPENGWSLDVINGDAKVIGREVWPPRKGTMFYRLDGTESLRLDGSTDRPGQVFSYPYNSKQKQRTPLLTLLRNGLQAKRDLQLTLPPDKDPISIPIAGFYQAIQRFTDVCPL